jgi:hypothetical protein
VGEGTVRIVDSEVGGKKMVVEQTRKAVRSSREREPMYGVFE